MSQVPACYFKNNQQVQALNDAIALKANASDVANSLSDVSNSLDLEANASDAASSLSFKADQLAVDATITSFNASIDTKYPTSDAKARIAEEKKFYEAVQANIYISGPDGFSEIDCTYLL